MFLVRRRARHPFSPPLTPYDGPEARRVRDLGSFVAAVRQSGQFLDGVFLAVDGAPHAEVLAADVTADRPMEEVAPGTVVEVHAFDATLIEVYTNRPALIEQLRQRFGGRLRAPSG